MSFVHAIRHGGNAHELSRLRGMVQEVTGVYHNMPDKTLADVLRRKIFINNIEIPENKHEDYHNTFVDIFGEDYEDLFKI